MSASRNTMRWGRVLTAVIVLVTLAVWIVASIKTGEIAKMQWAEISAFVASVSMTMSAPYFVNRSTFKHPDGKNIE